MFAQQFHVEVPGAETVRDAGRLGGGGGLDSFIAYLGFLNTPVSRQYLSPVVFLCTGKGGKGGGVLFPQFLFVGL